MGVKSTIQKTNTIQNEMSNDVEYRRKMITLKSEKLKVMKDRRDMQPKIEMCLNMQQALDNGKSIGSETYEDFKHVINPKDTPEKKTKKQKALSNHIKRQKKAVNLTVMSKEPRFGPESAT